MTIVTNTPTSIRLQGDCVSRLGAGVAGGVLVAGEYAYLDQSTNTYFRATSAGTQAQAGVSGLDDGLVFCLSGAGNPGDVFAFLRGPCTFEPGGVLVDGESYDLATVAGKAASSDEWAPGEFKTSLGNAISTKILKFDPQPSGSNG